MFTRNYLNYAILSYDANYGIGKVKPTLKRINGTNVTYTYPYSVNVQYKMVDFRTASSTLNDLIFGSSNTAENIEDYTIDQIYDGITWISSNLIQPSSESWTYPKNGNTVLTKTMRNDNQESIFINEVGVVVFGCLIYRKLLPNTIEVPAGKMFTITVEIDKYVGGEI